MASNPPKRQKTTADTASEAPEYTLVYWPTIPGRGEHIRLCFEATRTPYIDVGNASPAGIKTLQALIDPSSEGDSSNPVPLAPPVLQHGNVQLSQTSNILMYLGPKLGLVPNNDAVAAYHVNALALTALDGLSNETHDTHHPIAVSAYYEDQKPEALKKSQEYIANRLPKFMGYFERVLRSPFGGQDAQWLVGGQLTYADLVLFQCVDGHLFAFPKAMQALRHEKKYVKVFELYERVKRLEAVKAYLESERRMKYSMGIYRHYPELDLQS